MYPKMSSFGTRSWVLAVLMMVLTAWLAGSAPALSPTRTTHTFVAHTIDKPPFYAVPLCAGITVTSGGLCVDGRARVLDTDEKPIVGLYAAGSAVGGLEGGPRTGYVGGLIKAFAIGRIAGREIASGLAN